MEDIVMSKLISAIDTNKYDNLLNQTNETIDQTKKQMLLNLHLSKKDYHNVLNKLKHYQFVDELSDMKYGSYIRWINLTNVETLKLTNGGIVCEIKMGEKGMIIVCRNNMNRFFQFNANETLIFRKMTDQELILLSALDYISVST